MRRHVIPLLGVMLLTVGSASFLVAQTPDSAEIMPEAARQVELIDGDAITLEGVRISPFRLAEDYVYAFLFEGGDRRVLIAPDELFGWDPPDSLSGLDLAVLPMGVAEFNPLTGERHIDAEHSVLKLEATFRQTLEMIDKLSPSRTILIHIEEPDALSHDDLLIVADQVSEQGGRDISFAYDTLSVEV